MEIRITGRKFAVGERLNERITDRVNKLTRFWERLTSIHVTLDRDGTAHAVEILVSAEHKHDFVARAADENLLAAVDQAVEKLQRQLARYKNKILGRRKGVKEPPVSAPGDQEEPPQAEVVEDDSDETASEGGS